MHMHLCTATAAAAAAGLQQRLRYLTNSGGRPAWRRASDAYTGPPQGKGSVVSRSHTKALRCCWRCCCTEGVGPGLPCMGCMQPRGRGHALGTRSKASFQLPQFGHGIALHACKTTPGTKQGIAQGRPPHSQVCQDFRHKLSLKISKDPRLV